MKNRSRLPLNNASSTEGGRKVQISQCHARAWTISTSAWTRAVIRAESDGE